MGLALGLFLTVATLTAQAPAEAPPSAYEQLLARYASGDFDRAVDAAAAKPADDFEAPFDAAWNRAKLAADNAHHDFRSGKSQTPTEWHQAQDRLARLLIAATLLHTEASLITSGEQVVGHLDLARTAIQSLEDVKVERHTPDSTLLGPEQVAHVVHDWHVLAASVLIARGTGVPVSDFLTKARQRYPRDPGLELALGVFHERQASEAVVDVSLIREIYMSEGVGSWRHVLELAAAACERSQKYGLEGGEAQLRLGRIHALLGDDRKALAELAPIADSESSSSLRYLAIMVLGEMAEGAGRRDEAQSRYLEALVLYPNAQAPMLALSRQRDQAGDAAGARAWLERSLKAVSSHRVDPWWIYGKAPLWSFNDMVGALRRYLRP